MAHNIFETGSRNRGRYPDQLIKPVWLDAGHGAAFLICTWRRGNMGSNLSKAFVMVAVLGLGLSLPTSAGFNEGVAAYSRGDYASALREWYVPASQGEARAQYNIGVMYYKGIGTRRNLNEAAKWISAAAKQENGAAQLYLGVMHSLGEGVPQDLVLSHSWLDRAIMNLPEGPDRIEAIRQRTFVESKLSPAQISEAQRIATTPVSLEPAVASPAPPHFHAPDAQPLPSIEPSRAETRDIALLPAEMAYTVTAMPELAAIEQVRVRAYEHENFARIVFDWPQRVAYTTQLNRNRLLVSFSRPATFDLRAVNRNLAGYVGPPEVRDDQALISFPLTDEFEVKTFALGSRVVIDLKRGRLAREYPPPTRTAGYTTYTIKKGDTLWGISNRLRPADVTVNQMMLALLKRNPHAFLKKNVHRLEAGFTLQVPNRQEIVSVAPREANREMTRQEMAWRKTSTRKQPKLTPKQPKFEWADPSQPDPDFAVAPDEMPDVAETTQSTEAAEPAGDGADTSRDRLAQLQQQVKTMQELLAVNEGELERLRNQLVAKPKQQMDSGVDTPARSQDGESISFAALLTVNEQELMQLRNQLAMMLEDPAGSGNGSLMDANAAGSISFAALLTVNEQELDQLRDRLAALPEGQIAPKPEIPVTTAAPPAVAVPVISTAAETKSFGTLAREITSNPVLQSLIAVIVALGFALVGLLWFVSRHRRLKESA